MASQPWGGGDKALLLLGISDLISLTHSTRLRKTSGRKIGSQQIPLLTQHTTNSRDENIYCQWNSEPVIPANERP